MKNEGKPENNINFYNDDKKHRLLTCYQELRDEVPAMQDRQQAIYLVTTTLRVGGFCFCFLFILDCRGFFTLRLFNSLRHTGMPPIYFSLLLDHVQNKLK